MTKDEQAREIGALALRLKEAKVASTCARLRARSIARDLRVFIQVLEGDEPISALAELPYPDRAALIRAVEERDEFLSTLAQLQAEWNQVKPD